MTRHPALLFALLLSAVGCNNLRDVEGIERTPAETGGENNATNNSASNNAPGNNAPGNNAPGNNSPGNNNPGNNNPGNNSASCTDRDGDGAPSGASCAEGLRVDCDDADASRSPFEAELCNGLDEDCDEVADEGVSAPTCPLREGVCLGSRKPCLGESGFGACGAAEYGDAWVEEEDNLCDGLDNDCDGQTDEGCACEEGDTQLCGSDEGACSPGVQRCEEGAWGACLDATGPQDEVCDGVDNDCDGQIDNDLEAPFCALQAGLCQGSRATCQGEAGWSACGATEYGDAWVQDEAARCDGLDNDCDGTSDEGCACVDGESRACGTDVGACEEGSQRCQAGQWGPCAGSTGPMPEICDGIDNDCDGMNDETCACETGQTRACGTDVGACEAGTQQCMGGQWGACRGGVGPTPETCDGLDNDCNGVVDEGLWQACDACFARATTGPLLGNTNTNCNGFGTCFVNPTGVVMPPSGALEQPICPGTFTQGSTADAFNHEGELSSSPAHAVTLSRPLLASSVELTEGAFALLYDYLPVSLRFDSASSACTSGAAATCPKRDLNWFETLALANAFTSAFNFAFNTDLSSCYELGRCSLVAEDEAGGAMRLSCPDPIIWDNTCTGFRLPTEAEWEYMTRAGTTGAWHNASITDLPVAAEITDCVVVVGLGEIARYCYNSQGSAWGVAGLRANPWSLWDVSGNVEEWVWDLHGDYPSAPQSDPQGPSSSGSEKRRITRGGHYQSHPLETRSAARSSAHPTTHTQTRGVRFVRTLEPLP